MKVLDNLENYDVHADVRLSAKEEAELADALRAIVLALIPIRNSKSKTRIYFNQHLRYSSNVNDFLAENPGAEEEDYVLEPGEYRWFSDILQLALLDILEPDKFIFGYVVNYINEDLALRNGSKYSRKDVISDTLVKFANEFDIEMIRDTADNILDLHDRLEYLNRVYTQYQIYDGLTRDEEEMCADAIGKALIALQGEVQKSIEIQKSRGSKDKIHHAPKILPNRVDQFNPKRGMLYDLAVCSEKKFVPLQIDRPKDWERSSLNNKKAFAAILDNKFATCFNVEYRLERDEDTFNLLPLLVVRMFDSYVEILKSSYSNGRLLIQKIVHWVDTTRGLIESAYKNNPIIYSLSDPYEMDGELYLPNDDTSFLKFAILRELYRYAPYVIEEFLPDMPGALSNVVLFNMWGDLYEIHRKQLANQFGLDYKKRAIVHVKENKEYFARDLNDKCILFCKQVGSGSEVGSDAEVIENIYTSMSENLFSYFRDYLSRLRSLSNSKEGLDACLITWAANLQSLVIATYENNHITIERQDDSSPAIRKKCCIFYLDICEKIAFDIAKVYFEDYERLDLVQSNHAPITEQEPESRAFVTEADPTPAPETEQPNHDGEKPSSVHNRTIDYETLYNEWNGNAFTRASLEEFTLAIDSADFSKMLKYAEDAGQKSGYIGGIKYIMKCLREQLGSNWFEIACENIGETPNSLNKLNDGTRQIKKINVKIISQCVK